MLVDAIALCAPVVVALPAVVVLLTSHVSLASKSRAQRRLYGTLLLAEKLPPDVLGGALISNDIDRQTLHVAYLAQYPQRARRRAALAQQRGDVFEAAWLSAHYRNERRRVAEHWALLHKARAPIDA